MFYYSFMLLSRLQKQKKTRPYSRKHRVTLNIFLSFYSSGAAVAAACTAQHRSDNELNNIFCNEPRAST